MCVCFFHRNVRRNPLSHFQRNAYVLWESWAWHKIWTVRWKIHNKKLYTPFRSNNAQLAQGTDHSTFKIVLTTSGRWTADERPLEKKNVWFSIARTSSFQIQRSNSTDNICDQEEKTPWCKKTSKGSSFASKNTTSAKTRRRDTYETLTKRGPWRSQDDPLRGIVKRTRNAADSDRDRERGVGRET